MRNDIDDKSSLTAAELVTTKFSHRGTYEPANALGKGDMARLVNHSIAPFPYLADVSYAPRGWVSTVTTTAPGGAGRTTIYTYDNVGQLTGVTQPDGSTLSYSYDAAHRLVAVTDAKGNSISYTLDNMGNRTGEDIKDPTGVLQRGISRSFDALNRVQQVTGAAQ